MNKILKWFCEVIMFMMGATIGLFALDKLRWLVYSLFIEFNFSKEISYYSTIAIMLIVCVAAIMLLLKDEMVQKKKNENC